MKKFIFYIFFAIVSVFFGCMSFRDKDTDKKKSVKVWGIYNDYFKNTTLIVCTDSLDDYLILSEPICADSAKYKKNIINLYDTINIVMYTRTKPLRKDFMYKSSFYTREETNLYVVSKDTTLDAAIVVASRDSVYGKYYYSPDICGEYLIRK